MITKIDYAQLTPAIYAIYAHSGAHFTCGEQAANALRLNIEKGQEIYTGVEVLPEEFRPDYPALHEVWTSGTDDAEGVTSSYNVWDRTEDKIDLQLYTLFQAGDYAAMVELVRETADPGPTSVHARKDWEAGKGRE